MKKEYVESFALRLYSFVSGYSFLNDLTAYPHNEHTEKNNHDDYADDYIPKIWTDHKES